MKFKTMFTAKGRIIKSSRKYPESRVVLDPTCTLEQILNRAQYGMKVPQRDVSGDITAQELEILGLNGTSLATMSRMELIDLRMRAQMRLSALEAKKLKQKKAVEDEKYRKGIIDEYEKQKSV